MITNSIFVCQSCGNEFSKWQGKCSYCGEWNSLVETVNKINNKKLRGSKQTSSVKIQKLSDVQTQEIQRTKTNIQELDRVLGGGLVSGQVVLIAGEPGIGKSTLLLQVANNFGKTVYVSGEESISQVGIRAKRLKVASKNIQFIESTDIDQILDSINSLNSGTDKPSLIIIDSIQTMSTSDLTGLAGSVGQVRECAFRALRLAKVSGIPLIIVGHVTKEGTVAGPAVLAHIVDSVLWFEGDKKTSLRLLRPTKNRFGSTDEVGIFIMEECGLVSLDKPEEIFVENKGKLTSGSVLTIIVEGSRSILVEIESLVVTTKMPIPRRVAQGIDSKRLEMLLAILTRRANIPLYDMDVFVNIAGGIKANEPSIDLAVCLSIASAYMNKPIKDKVIPLGEVSLSGEIKKASFQEKRVKDAKRLGFKNVITSSQYSNLQQVISILLK